MSTLTDQKQRQRQAHDQSVVRLLATTAEGLTMGQLADATGIPSRTMTDVVKRLIARGEAVRPARQRKVYAAGQSLKRQPARRKSPPTPRQPPPRPARPAPPQAPAPRPPARPRRPSPRRFELALETLERHPEGVRELVGQATWAIGGLVGLLVRHSPRFRRLLEGSGSRWPVSERLLAQAAALDQSDPKRAASFRQQAAAVQALLDSAKAAALRQELGEMLAVPTAAELEQIGQAALTEDPPNPLTAELAVGELRRRAEQQQRQRRSGPPVRAPSPALRVVEPPTNGGLSITMGPDPRTGRRVDLDVLSGSVSQREMLIRAHAYDAGRYVGGEARAVAPPGQRGRPAGWETQALTRRYVAIEQAAKRQRTVANAAGRAEQARRQLGELEREYRWARRPAWLSGRRYDREEVEALAEAVERQRRVTEHVTHLVGEAGGRLR